MKTRDDIFFIKQCLEGNREAFRELVHRYQGFVFHIVFRMSRDMEISRDLTQDVFIKAYTKLDTYNAHYTFKTWIGRIATYHTIDYLRRKKTENLMSVDNYSLDGSALVDQVLSREPSQEQKLLQDERAQMMARMLKKLDPKLRAIIVLRHYEDMNYNEIADTLNIPVGTVKNRLFRAREKLQKLFIDNSLFLQEVVL